MQGSKQECNEGGRGAQFPGRQITMGAPNNWWGGKVPLMSQVLSLIQHIFFQKTLVSNMGAPNLFLATAVI